MLQSDSNIEEFLPGPWSEARFLDLCDRVLPTTLPSQGYDSDHNISLLLTGW